MKKGQTAFVMIPPELAYGEEGYGDMVPPNATLVFKIEVVDIINEDEPGYVDPFDEQDPNMPDFDKHTPNFQKNWKEQQKTDKVFNYGDFVAE